MENRSFSTPQIGQQKRSGLFFPLLLLTLIIGMLIGWLCYEFAPQSIHALMGGEQPSSSFLANYRSIDDKDLKAVKQERDRMRQRIVALERASQIDKIALQQLKKEIIDEQNERLRQEEKMAFLRGVATQNKTDEGLRIRDFRISQTSSDDVFRYRFTVTQALNRNGEIKGDIQISLIGRQKGKKKTLKLSEVTADKLKSLKMKFKHFQDLEGVIQLPKGFTPKKFSIKIKAGTGDDVEKIEKKYDWVVNT